MSKKAVAVGSALASVALAVGVGFGVASATEPRPPAPSGDNCTVNGNFNVVVAPNCQAGSPTTTNPPVSTLTRGPLPTFVLPTLGPLPTFTLVPVFPTSTTSGGLRPQPFP